MKVIKTQCGKDIIVDEEDFHYLSRFDWYMWNTKTGTYPTTQISKKNIIIHEIIIRGKRGFYIKHKNDNTLDNRKENFELLSINHRRHLGMKKQIGVSQYRGLQINSKKGKKWKVMIAKDKVRYFLGYFESEVEAAIAYNKKAKELYGDNAYQNII